MDEMKDGQKVVSAGKTTCVCGANCTCGCGHRGMHRLLWWILGIVVLVIVFCIGVKAGEVREELRGMFGNNYYRAYPMMQHINPGGPMIPANGTSGSATGTTSAAPMIPAQQ